MLAYEFFDLQLKVPEFRFAHAPRVARRDRRLKHPLNGYAGIPCGATIMLECAGNEIRAVYGAREVGVMEDPGSLVEAMRQRGSVATATVLEYSAFGDLTARIREEN